MKGKILITLFSLSLLVSCQEQEKEPTSDNNSNTTLEKQEFVFDVMQSFYLWENNVSLLQNYKDDVDFSLYKNEEDLFDDIIYEEKDRWSFMMSTSDAEAYFNQGINPASFGVRFGLNYQTGDVYVIIIYSDSPFYAEGINNRGWKVVSIDGVSVRVTNDTEKNNFLTMLGEDKVGVTKTFELAFEGTTKTITVTKKDIHLNSVLMKKVFERDNKKIGYLLYDAFLSTSNVELDEAFQYFASEDITKLILDLRYNGGGSVDIAIDLCGKITGNTKVGEVLINYTYNKYLTGAEGYPENKKLFSVNNPVMGIDELIVIAKSSTASASELVIDGLREELLFPVKVVGKKTEGKYVGSYLLHSKLFKHYYDWDDLNITLSPITFKYGDFEGGIDEDITVEDDFSEPFGEATESMLAVALEYIKTGSIPVARMGKVTQKEAILLNDKKGLRGANGGIY